MGVVPLLIFFNEASINTFLDRPVPVERDRDDASLASFQIQVSVSGPSGPVFYKRGEAARCRTPPHRLSAVSGVKVKTLEFLQKILLSMEVALSMFFLFLPISSFGRHRTIVPLRGTLLPIVQRIH